jgi:hypothetical protein
MEFFFGKDELILAKISFSDDNLFEICLFVVFLSEFIDDLVILGFLMRSDAGVESGDKKFLELIFFEGVMGMLAQSKMVKLERLLLEEGLTALVHNL